MKKLFMILACTGFFLACSDEKTEEAKPSATIVLSAETMTFLATGDVAQGENQVTVTSSGDWRLAGKQTWCKVSATQGKSGDRVTFVVDKNAMAESRSITYSFFCDNKTVKLIVLQQEDDVINSSQNNFEVGPQGASILKIRLESNVAFTPEISADDQTWIVPKTELSRANVLERSYLYYTISENKTYNSRVGVIRLQSASTASRKITIHQAQNDTLLVETDAYQEELAAKDIRVTVWSNVPYSVEIPEEAKSWITLAAEPVAPVKWSSQELVFHLLAADRYRAAQIMLVASKPALSHKISIQQGEPATVSFPDALFAQYLVDKGYVIASGDKYVLLPAGLAATEINVYPLWETKPDGGCQSLAGIENFTNLETLNCSFNRIRALDLRGTKVSDVSKCVPNALTSLHVGSGINFVNFGAKNSWNDGKLFDYSTNVFSTQFVVSGEEIEMINVSRNQLQMLDVSGCPKLIDLRCQQKDATSLKILYMSKSQEGNVSITKDDATQIIYK